MRIDLYMNHSANMMEIARRCGVSQPVVSAVLNGRWRERRIAVATHDRIQAMAQELNYRPNRLANNFKSGRTNTLALVMPAIRHSFFPDIAMGVEAEAKRHGYHVLLSHVPSGEELAAELEALLQRRVDGLIISPHFHLELHEKYRELLAQKTPMVFVNDYFADVPCSSVIGDDWTGMYQATEHLIKLGHRRIAHLAGGVGPTVVQNRVDGFCAAMREYGLEVSEDYVQWCEKDRDSSYENMQRLLALPHCPTAVTSMNDLAALRGIKAVWDAGLRVPDDMAFVGYGDDLEEVWFHKLPLTTVNIDAQEMGRRAMQRLLLEMADPAAQKTIEKIKPQLIVRQSCGASLGVTSGITFGDTSGDLAGSCRHPSLYKEMNL